ncbi:hypothetical protein ACV3RS_09765 [Clostridium perfringens]
MENRECIEILEDMLKRFRRDLSIAHDSFNQREVVRIAENIEALNHVISILENLNPKKAIFI